MRKDRPIGDWQVQTKWREGPVTSKQDLEWRPARLFTLEKKPTQFGLGTTLPQITVPKINRFKTPEEAIAAWSEELWHTYTHQRIYNIKTREIIPCELF